MTFEGFNGTVDRDNYSTTLTLTYDGDEPDKDQKDSDFKDMLDYITIAFANAVEISGGTVDAKKESGNTFHFGDDA
jgi:hypothetical protein